jgi:predicted ATP-grasp superfamily ATP-dependent carboligase
MTSDPDLGGVVVTSGGSASNQLGVVRSFGRHGIPVVYLDSGHRSFVGYSKHITRRLKCPSSIESPREFVDVLLDFGRIDGRMMIVPTGDMDALAISKHKRELERYYFVPVSAHATVEKLVNKKLFYELLAETRFPHPKTYFPENLAELESMGLETPYPYIVKPVYSSLFHETFGRKNFVIRSREELESALEKLRKKRTLRVMIQEIVGIPGKQLYAFYAYLNRNSEPLAVCGYDKIRQSPSDFGSGSYCKSNWMEFKVRMHC